jgi:hypothetical protein
VLGAAARRTGARSAAWLVRFGEEVQVQAQRVLIFVAMFGLALAPGVALASAQGTPEASPTADALFCSGDYLGPGPSYADPGEGTRAYRFVFPAGSEMEEMLYQETVIAVVENGSIRITLGDDVPGRVAVDPGPGSAFIERDEPAGGLEAGTLTAIEPGQVVELTEGSVVFHQNAEYRYDNTGDDDTTLIVTLAALEDGVTAPPNDHVFAWCEMIGQTGLRSAKRIPAQMCGGG